MKSVRFILMLILFGSLGAPCVHGDSHHDHEEDVTLNAVVFCDGCHSLPDEHCSKPLQAIKEVSSVPVGVLEQRVPLFTLPEYRQPLAGDKAPRNFRLQLLQSVQLLI